MQVSTKTPHMTVKCEDAGTLHMLKCRVPVKGVGSTQSTVNTVNILLGRGLWEHGVTYTYIYIYRSSGEHLSLFVGSLEVPLRFWE